MLILGKYTTDEAAKFLVSLAAVGVAAVAMFFVVDPGLGPAIETLIIAAAGAFVVLGTKNATADAIDKAVMQFVVAGIALLNYFIKVDPGVVTKIGGFVFVCVSAYAVWRKGNTTR